MDDLPSCILVNILSRLPAISILRLRSVSKFWLETIDDPSFRSLLKPEETLFLGVSDGYWKYEPRIYRITSGGPGMAPKEMGNFFRELLDYRFKNSCNGWLYFEDHFLRKQFKSIVVNPFTRKVVNVPGMPERAYNDRVERALGFDNSTGTFKLIELSSEEWTGDGFGAAMYNFKTRCWTPCEAPRCPSHMLFSRQIHASDTGTLYWITGYYTRGSFYAPLILSFDMEKEEFRVIPFPHPAVFVHMTELNGRLTLFHTLQKSIKVYELVDRQSYKWELTYRIPTPPDNFGVMDVHSYSMREILVAADDPIASHLKTIRFYLWDMESKGWENLGEVTLNCLRRMSVLCLKPNIVPLEGSVAIRH